MSRFYHLASLLLVAPLSLAWYTANTTLTLAQVVGDPQCASNETAFHALNEIHIDQTPSAVWELVGNFQNLTWQGATNITVSGTQNAPNNTHTQQTPSGAATEELRTYLGPSSSPANPSQSVYFMQFFLQPLPGGLSGVTFDSVEDLLLAVKDGNGTKLTWETSTVIIFSGGQPTPAT
ncbi:hypothetical protein EHS25_001362 [Saitozyma podzolica]|uniref:Uncharacterized protein n=1 Tax=Saitozyma podzolica TaxID=1890683 RepID=A0A427YFS7_9TREE|nr:hypothetical protein EHS25_001362 [Saitozyma podzolica]